MLTLTVKELLARKLRLFATAAAVVLGVAFMAGSFVFSDSVAATFDSALAEANAGVDAYVRVPPAVDLGYGEAGARFDASVADAVAGVDGVDEVALRVNGYAQLVGADGRPVGDISQSPAFGTNWVAVADLNPYQLAGGRAPVADDEVVVDVASAREGGFEPGDRATVLTKREPRQVTIVGVATFAGADSPAGATVVLFTTAAAQELLAAPGQVDGIAVSGDGVAQADLAAAVQAAVGGGLEVITGDALVAEDQASFADDFGAFRTITLAFAVIGVFVGAFIINNTFSITVAQRTREMAMLRAVGASARQVRRSVLVEALLVGVVASAAGLAAGVGVASGLEALLGVFGIDLPEGPTVVSPGAMAIAFGVGVGVTVLSAWLPARRAARIAPIAALRGASVDRSGGSVGRTTAGALVTAAGVAALFAGLAAGELTVVGGGAAVAFVGVSVLAPVLAPPFARLLGGPLRLRGISGDLATRNAVRNPRRTARAASSLMIGVGLVGMILVLAASTKASLAGSLDTEFTGTHIVGTDGWDATSGLSPRLADTLRATPGVDVVTQARLSPAVVDGTATDALYAFDATTVGEVFDLGAVAGDLGGLGADGIAVAAETAEAEGWTIGSPVRVTFPSGEATLVVEAVYDGSTDWVGTRFVDLAAFRAHVADELDHRIYVIGDEEAIRGVAAAWPTAEVLDREAFLDDVGAEIDTMLGMFTALLALAVLIGLLGIANTLALSIFERTRELGLLRAVGMVRSQVRSAVRLESIVVAVFGAGLGLGVGTFFGWAVVRAMADQGVDTLAVPVGSLAAVTAVAALAGAVAGVVPARRAARLEVLAALATA